MSRSSSAEPEPAPSAASSAAAAALTTAGVPPPAAAPRPEPTVRRRVARRFTVWALALLGLLLGDALGLWTVPGLVTLNHALHDLALRVQAPAGPESRIVLVEIDERALAAQGRWPWRRRQLAALLEALADRGGARLIGLDLVLAEPDDSAGLATLERLARGELSRQPAFLAALDALRPALDDDARLAATLARVPVVLGIHLSNETGAAQTGQLPPPLVPAPAAGAVTDPWPSWAGHSANLPALQAAALGAGHLAATLDDDGVVRRLPLLVRHGGGIHPTLALAMARAAAAGSAPVLLRLAPARPPLQQVSVQAGGWRLSVPVDGQAQVLVPFRPAPAFQRVSAADVLAGQVGDEVLRGKLVLVSVSAPGLADQRRTPVDEAMLGTLVHANLLSGLLDGRLPRTPASAPGLVAAGLLLPGLLLIAALPRLRARHGALLALALWALLLAGQWWLWHGPGVVLPAAAALLLPPLLLGSHGLLALLAASRARRALTQLFGQYVPPELVSEMARAPERHSMRSRQAELSVLFADVRGFTGLAERMPPEALSAMMNLLFSHLTDTLRAHRGTLDKYIGDAVMAFWGAPVDDPNHARHAVAAALAMQAGAPALQAELQRRGWPALRLSIGINSGPVVAGDMGSRHRRAYTVMGDAVNLAARLQALCSQHDLGLLVGDATRRALGDRLCLPLGRLALRGRDAGEPVWWPLPWHAGEHPPADRLHTLWLRMRQAWDDGRLADARALLDEVDATGLAAPLCRWQRGQWPASTVDTPTGRTPSAPTQS